MSTSRTFGKAREVSSAIIRPRLVSYYTGNPILTFHFKYTNANMADSSKSVAEENVLHPLEFLQTLDKMRVSGEGCDVTLKVTDQSFPGHKLVLAANSTYFRAMFGLREGFVESSKNDVVLHDLDPKGVNAVISYFYNSKIEINADNFEAVFAVANMWDVKFVLTACENYLRVHLSASNCLGFQILVHQSSAFSENFRTLLDDFVNKNFMVICQHEEMLIIPVEHLEKILKGDELCVKSEEIVCQAVLRWLRHDVTGRKQNAARLLLAVRLGLLSDSFITLVLFQNDVIQCSDECKNLLRQVLHHSESLPAYLWQARHLSALYLFGGYLNNTNPLQKAILSSAFVEYLDFHGKKWEKLYESFVDEAAWLYFRAVCTKNFIYIIGERVMRYSIATKEWQDLNVEMPLRNYIIHCGLVAHGETIYAIGGLCNAIKLSSDVTQQSLTWEGLPQTVVDHYRPGVCLLGDNVFVVGGCDRAHSDAHTVVEQLDISDPHAGWAGVVSLTTPRWGLGAVVLNKKIFAVGGFDTDNRAPIGTVEVYSPRNDTWTQIKPLNRARRRFGIAEVDGTIFVAGGFSEDSSTNSTSLKTTNSEKSSTGTQSKSVIAA
ncbi:kelch-like protein 18 [Nematostella vectensis]|uniref:kelch-like protein 18 n=1 Tax=Nematostella vectensis TaxID=45351 RepID=UPI00138FC620|nr:kelch-like protein 18 [Nematostella vectensis]